jgi:hypothetical protein
MTLIKALPKSGMSEASVFILAHRQCGKTVLLNLYEKWRKKMAVFTIDANVKSHDSSGIIFANGTNEHLNAQLPESFAPAPQPEPAIEAATPEPAPEPTPEIAAATPTVEAATPTEPVDTPAEPVTPPAEVSDATN